MRYDDEVDIFLFPAMYATLRCASLGTTGLDPLKTAYLFYRDASAERYDIWSHTVVKTALLIYSGGV